MAAPEGSDLTGLVYIKTGRMSGVAALLTKSGDQLVLATEEGERFRVPVGEAKVEFPWWYGNGGMRITVAGTRYTLGFSPPARVEGEGLRLPGEYDEQLAQGLVAWRTGRQWKAALRPGH